MIPGSSQPDHIPGGVPLAQVANVLEAVEEVLGSDVLGVYLYGSAVAGGLRHRSDLDLLVVVERLPDDEERAALVQALLPVARRAGKRPEDRSLELTVVVRSDVVPWRYPPRQAFQYGEWEREAYLTGFVPAPRPEADLAVLLTIAVARGVALAGPPISALLAPVPAADLRRALVDLIPRLDGDLESDTAERAAHDGARLGDARDRRDPAQGRGGVVGDRAGARGRSRVPSPGRRGVYLGTEADRWEDLAADLRPAADALLAEIRAAAGS